ncbi:hypothetical protein [Venatoribacter cucullus]|uniref:hypothetical protein n=1 Tax=Venatoribacter cucullus TaxID=2661630 RepID=UPI00223F0B6B|nr:hypothetical protein [Venatoribacter cucullus]UZK04773.1 hypothetical protein GAY96_13060 [Venatoribacter cucullus]
MTAELRNGDVLKVFHALAEKWQMSSEEQATLLGIAVEEYSALSKNTDQKACSGLVHRIAQLADIQKAAEAIAPIGHSKNFITRSNTSAPLNGISIREYLLTKNTDADIETLARWMNSIIYG